jgi:pentapeptide repeat protein
MAGLCRRVTQSRHCLTAVSDPPSREPGLALPPGLGAGLGIWLIVEVVAVWVAALLPDPHHLEILRRGPRAWNAWREQNPSELPLLMELTLSLSERQLGPISGGPINLTSARLRNGSLRFATLSEADLAGADLSNADLVHARLDRANLTAANLSGAILDKADFANAKLARVNLSGASLNDAQNLTQAQISDSIGNSSTILPPHLKVPESWISWSESPRTLPATTSSGSRASQDLTSFAASHRAFFHKPILKTAALVGAMVLIIGGLFWQNGPALDALESRDNNAPSSEPRASLEREAATEIFTPNPAGPDSEPIGTAEPITTAVPNTGSDVHEPKPDEQASVEAEATPQTALAGDAAQGVSEGGHGQAEAVDGSMNTLETEAATPSPHVTDLRAETAPSNPQAPPTGEPPIDVATFESSAATSMTVRGTIQTPAAEPSVDAEASREPHAINTTGESADATLSALRHGTNPDLLAEAPQLGESPTHLSAANTSEPSDAGSVTASQHNTLSELTAKGSSDAVSPAPASPAEAFEATSLSAAQPGTLPEIFTKPSEPDLKISLAASPTAAFAAKPPEPLAPYSLSLLQQGTAPVADAFKSDPKIALAVQSLTAVLAAKPPEPLALPQHGAGPVAPADALEPDPEIPPAAESLTALQPTATSPPTDPPVATAALPLDAPKGLLPDVAGPPRPDRKPLIPKSDVVPRPVKKPFISRDYVEPTPVRKPVIQRDDLKPKVIEKVEVKPKAAPHHRAKVQGSVEKRPDPSAGSGTIADVLAGGL